ncbi:MULTISPECIES: SHOCT domain-containing protein [unclassified Haladaptatus]|uniref:SHOCT domain-containing protein n=1 Tax=unclassified Haladaptatus TaxID=2622732 RepID=UPI0023E84DE4|nr:MULTISPECIES: SHOCT domain-containing protein [unclassified Haladaptatus]
MSAERTSDGLLRIVLIVLAVIVLFPLLMMVFAMPMMGMMGWWWGGGMAGGLSPLWGIGMMLVWLVVLVGIGYLLYRGLVGGVGSAVTGDRALEELRVAYARGELTEEEFEERHARLSREELQ